MKLKGRIILVILFFFAFIDYSDAQTFIPNKYDNIYLESNLRQMPQNEFMKYMDLAQSARRQWLIVTASGLAVGGFSLIMAIFTFNEFWDYPFYAGAAVASFGMSSIFRWNRRYKLTQRISQERGYNSDLTIQPLMFSSGIQPNKMKHTPGIRISINF
jgi:hypothetical protein